MQLSFDLPLFSEKQGQDTQEIKNYLYRLTEQLRYILSNLDGDNFSGELTGELKAQLNNSYAALKSSCDRLSGEVSGLKNRVITLESMTESGTAELDDGLSADISFTDRGSIPTVAASFIDASEADAAVTVHSVTQSTAKIISVGASRGTKVRWTAIY